MAEASRDARPRFRPRRPLPVRAPLLSLLGSLLPAGESSGCTAAAVPSSTSTARLASGGGRASTTRGGWSGKTTVERTWTSPLRAFLKGWKMLFLDQVTLAPVVACQVTSARLAACARTASYLVHPRAQVEVLNELPSNLEAYRKQQHRWTCGPVQLTIQSFGQIWASRKIGPLKKTLPLPDLLWPPVRPGAGRPGQPVTCPGLAAALPLSSPHSHRLSHSLPSGFVLIAASSSPTLVSLGFFCVLRAPGHVRPRIDCRHPALRPRASPHHGDRVHVLLHATPLVAVPAPLCLRSPLRAL